MSKIFKIVLCLFAVAIIVFAPKIWVIGEMIFNNDKQEEKYVLNYELYDSYAVDITAIRQKWQIVDGTQFTYFRQLKLPELAKEYLLNEFDLELSELDFNFNDKLILMTIGREIVGDIEYTFLGKPYKPKTIAGADIVFSEVYHDQIMFIYVTDDILLGSEDTSNANSFYIMDGLEKKFWGHRISDINERYQISPQPQQPIE